MPNWDRDCDGSDTHCVRCGAPIYFQVGPGPIDCPACGGNYEYTDEQLRQRAIDQERANREALRNMQEKRRKIVFLHNLKAGRPPHEVALLDSIMDDVCFFESEAVRNGEPPLYETMV